MSAHCCSGGHINIYILQERLTVVSERLTLLGGKRVEKIHLRGEYLDSKHTLELLLFPPLLFVETLWVMKL